MGKSLTAEENAANSRWTETEKWVWEQVMQGQPADLRSKFEAASEPADPAGWPDTRSIRSSFLESILLSPDNKTVLARFGVRIVGAWVKEELDLRNADLSCELWLDESRFEENVLLPGACSTSVISFESSYFAKDCLFSSLKSVELLTMRGARIAGTLDMTGVNIAKGINLDQGFSCPSISLAGAVVGHQLQLSNASVKNILNLDDIFVGRDIFMDSAEFAEINLSCSELGGQLNARESRISGHFNMNNMIIKRDISMRNSTLKSFNLAGASIGGQMDLIKTTVEENAEMGLLSVRRGLQMEDSSFKQLSLFGAEIVGQLNMEGARITDEAILNGISVSQDLYMNRIEAGKISMIGGRVGAQLHIRGKTVIEYLELNELSVGNSVFFKGDAQLKNISFASSRIDGSLQLSGVRAEGLLNLQSAIVKQDLDISGRSSFGRVRLTLAQISGLLNITETTVAEVLIMNNLVIGGSLFIDRDSDFEGIGMINARIGNSIVLEKIRIGKEVLVQSTTVGGDVMIRSAKFAGRFSLLGSSINGSLRIRDSSFSFLDLAATSVRGELLLGEWGKKNCWTDESCLNLRSARVGTLSDAGEDSWPLKLEIDNFSYSGLVTASWEDSANSDIASRRSGWLIKWLERDKTFSSQPYQFMAQTLAQAGYSEKANSILVACRNRERKIAWQKKLWAKWLGLSLLNWTIGYGYGARYFYSLIWVIALTVLGIWVIGTVHTGAMRSAHIADKIGFSLDLLLPVVKLNEKFKIDFGGWQEAYFYFQKIMGFVLSSFVVAGLAGITKK
jgi:hypothetical protein